MQQEPVQNRLDGIDDHEQRQALILEHVVRIVEQEQPFVLLGISNSEEVEDEVRCEVVEIGDTGQADLFELVALHTVAAKTLDMLKDEMAQRLHERLAPFFDNEELWFLGMMEVTRADTLEALAILTGTAVEDLAEGIANQRLDVLEEIFATGEDAAQGHR